MEVSYKSHLDSTQLAPSSWSTRDEWNVTFLILSIASDFQVRLRAQNSMVTMEHASHGGARWVDDPAQIRQIHDGNSSKMNDILLIIRLFRH